ncbi:MAG: hypothetical protein H0V82_04070 [Candidatus Protochlamydia sp.]|nr:hypothetical protein [Candidatus Protochlamydia sp.]
MQITHIPLKYTSAEYKYEQITSIPIDEVCLLSQEKIKDLYENNINKGFPHVLAFVHDEAKGQDVYDANLFCDYLTRKERWNWLNPATNKTIRKIDFFVIRNLIDGYRLVKEINCQIGTGEAYEDLWLCNNLATASDPDNPYAFHSMRSMALHYNINNDLEKEKEVKYNCFKSIESHYGKGIALLLIPAILDINSLMLEKLLFNSFNYDFLNDYFTNSNLEKLIIENGTEFFNPNVKESEEIYRIYLNESLDNNVKHPSHQFVECLIPILQATTFKVAPLYALLKHPNKNVVSLIQALLWACGETKDISIRDLREYYPKWPLGEAYELSSEILSSKTIDLAEKSPVNRLIKLSSTSQDPLLLKITAAIIESFKITSGTWKQATNIYMKMIGISRFNINAVDMFVKGIEENELNNSLLLLSANFRFTNSYGSLLKLSDQQIAIGIKNKDKSLYDRGLNNGVVVFNNRDKHNFLTYSIGKILITEITPYKSSKEFESIGVEALEYTLKMTPNEPHPLAKLNLAEYLIRKGTTLQAQEAYQWLLDIQKQFPKDPILPYYFTRHALRFAKNEGDLNDIETKLYEIEKTNNKLPLFYLLKALWYSHPLKRNHPEWYILASQNLTKAFEDADQTGIDFLIKNIHRFDKLTENDQTLCKAKILYLLGLGDLF